MAAGEGPVVDGEGEAHGLVVDRPAAADEVLGGSDYGDVDDEPQEEAEREGVEAG